MWGGGKLARTYYLNPKLYNKLYAVMQYENSLALRTSLETGWRISDVLNLTPKQIQGRTVRIVAQKTGKADKKVISADLAKRLKQISGKEFVFEGRFGDKPRTRQAVWKDIKRSARQLKLDGNISCHSARKTYAVEDFKDGGLAKVQKDLQHSNVNTTMLYAFADLIDKMPAVKNIDFSQKKDEKPQKTKEKTEKTEVFSSDFLRFGDYVAECVVKKLEALGNGQ